MIKDLLQKIDINLDHVDEKLKETILTLVNIIEELAKENSELRQDNQRLRDENNRLKGEQGKPYIKPKRKNFSSRFGKNLEAERSSTSAYSRHILTPETIKARRKS